MTAARLPSACAADDDDDDGPAAGPSRPTAGDAVDPYTAYGVDDRARDEDAMNDAREDKPIAGPARPSATGSGAGGGRRARGTEHPPPARTRALFPQETAHPQRSLRVPRERHRASAPPGECARHVQRRLSADQGGGSGWNSSPAGAEIGARLRATKGFRNPDFLRSAVTHFDVDDRGTNFAEDVFDPKGYDSEDYYDRLGEAQKKETERREKERRAGFDRKMDFRSAASTLAAFAKAERGSARARTASNGHRTRQERGVGARRVGAGRR